MSRDSRLAVGLAPGLAALAILATAAQARLPAPAGEPVLRTFFSVRSAQPDDSLPVDLRGEFEKDEGGPLRSVVIDLDGDGAAEKLFLSSTLSASGGFQWLIYDVKNGVSRGVIVGTIIFVESRVDRGWPRLETYWRQGGDMSVVFRYIFDVSRYGRVETKVLTLAETSAYFLTKPPLDLERELVEIRSPV